MQSDNDSKNGLIDKEIMSKHFDSSYLFIYDDF